MSSVRILRSVRIHIAFALAFFSFVGGAVAQVPVFEFERYEELDAAVLGSDTILAAHERSSDSWRAFALEAATTRVALLGYIDGHIADPALDAETVEALLQVRATFALDIVVLALDTNHCELARRWVTESVRVVGAESVERFRTATARVQRECPIPVPVASTNEAIAPTTNRETVDPGPSLQPAPVVARAELQDEPPARPSRGAGWALLGTGAALGLGTVIIDASGSGDRALLNELACGAAEGCVQADLNSYNDARSRKNTRSAAMAALLVGAIGTSTTGIVLLTRRGRTADGETAAFPDVQLRTVGTALSATLRF